MKRITGAFLIAAVLTVTAACGGGDDRPSQAEVSESLTADDSVLPAASSEEQADCFAEILVESDLSDETLIAVVEQDQDYKGSEEDADILLEVSDDFVADCATS